MVQTPPDMPLGALNGENHDPRSDWKDGMTKKQYHRLCEAVCELNCWETPDEIRRKIKRKLERDEIEVAFAALEAFCPKKDWLRVWQKQDMGYKK